MKQGLLIAASVVAGAVIIGIGSWYVNTNINNPSGGTDLSANIADQTSNQAPASAGASAEAATSTNAAGASQSQSQTMDGLQVKDLKVGTGTVAESGDVVTVNYVGKLDDGSTFDSSASHGQPFSFTLGVQQVIKGWDLGVVGMKVGGERELTIPPDLGYGPGGYPPVIPPNATLHFTVTLLSVSKPSAQ